MHMADALLSPVVGATMCVVSAGTIVYCSRKVKKTLDDKMVPLMGVMGAFLFSAQMINFSIPVTGSSGHLGGGLLLTIILGPYAALLTIASVLVVQALFFADGGILALGCNIFNMGIIPAFIVFPLIYKRIIGSQPSQGRQRMAIMIAAIIGLQLGPFGVVLETLFSGISALPFSTFVLLMQPIHLAIGVVEGIATATIVSFVYNARPELIQGALEARPIRIRPVRNIIIAFMTAAMLTGGIVSWFASKDPDGLEWAVKKVTGKEALKGPVQGLHGILSALQDKTAVLPDYSFKKTAEAKDGASQPEGEKKNDEGSKLGTSVSGISGGLLTLVIVILTGLVLKKRIRPATSY